MTKIQPPNPNPVLDTPFSYPFKTETFRVVKCPPPIGSWDDLLFERPTMADLKWEEWNAEWWSIFGAPRPLPPLAVKRFHDYMDMAVMLGFATTAETYEVEELHQEDMLPF